MAPRLPVLSTGDPTYSSGNPVYDTGDDLGTATVTANFYGDTTVARFIMSGSGVRFAVKSDSQWSGGPARASEAVALTWPVTWSRYMATATPGDPWYVGINNSASDKLVTSQWNDTTEATDGATTIASIYTAEGIGDPSQIPLPFMWADDVGTAAFVAALRPRNGDDQGTTWYDANNWTGDTSGDGVDFRFRIMLLVGGSTGAETDINARTQYYDSGGSLQNANEAHPNVAGLSGDVKVTLNASNNNAILAAIDGDVVTSYESPSPFRPQGMINENSTDFDNASFFLFGGTVSRMVDASTEEDNTSMCLIQYASGMNPWMWIAGASSSNANKTSHGADRQVRFWVWENFHQPNVLVYSFGHNSITRSGTGFKAESAYQADLFDLIYQDASDYNAGTYTVRATSVTDDNGDWEYPMYLDSGSSYTLVYRHPSYSIATATVTVE